MSHKIESSHNSPLVANVRNTAAGNAGRPAESVRPNVGDSLKVTDQARLATRVIQAARQSPELDTQRVGTVRRAIDSGSYIVNAAAVASRMLQLEWQLSGP
ncbi:MAG TPA: flagellar biosynthesis anti-sigma factor FlgM [Fontimonas sp.]